MRIQEEKDVAINENPGCYKESENKNEDVVQAPMFNNPDMAAKIVNISNTVLSKANVQTTKDQLMQMLRV